MVRSYEYRLYPTRKQVVSLDEMLGHFCTLYNGALEERISAYRRGVRLSYADQALQLKACRAALPELAGYSFSAEQQVLRRLDKSYRAFFGRVQQGAKPGFPRFRAKRRYHSADFRVGDGLTIRPSRKLRMVGIDGELKVQWHRDFPAGARVKSAIVSRRCGKWYVIFHVELPEQVAPQRPFCPVGIDLGLNALVALSDGRREPTPQWTRDSAAKRRRLQRSAARKRRFGKNWCKAQSLVAAHHRRTANRRRDHLHKLAAGLAGVYSHIAVEDLNIKGLAAGMLAQSVHNAAWRQLIAFLTYKAESAGGMVESVDPRGTSQTCLCGEHVPKPTLGHREHRCPRCGLEGDRDVIAAQVILSRSSFGPGSGRWAQSKSVGIGLAQEAVCFS